MYNDDYEVVRILSEGTLRSEDILQAFMQGLEYLFYVEKAITLDDFDDWSDIVDNTSVDEVAELWEDISNWLNIYGYDILSNEYDPAIISIVRL